MLGAVRTIGVFGAVNPQSRSTPRGGEILLQNAARERKGRVDSVPKDAATETADTNPKSENRSEMVATVATVAAAGLAPQHSRPQFSLAWF